MTDWTPYTGDAEPHEFELPEAPPWRRFARAGSGGDEPDPSVTFQAKDEMVEAVNAALVLRRPLLLTGRPGSGKSSLIESVAHELQLGSVLRWHVTSQSTLTDALYRYDAIGRLQAHALGKDGGQSQPPEIGDFLRLGPLGTALLPSERPRALLIDEIDKSDIDLPNDLLNVFERGEYEIPELARLKAGVALIPRHDDPNLRARIEHGRVQCDEFPFVVLTSNGERDFAPAFLRRCIRLRMPEPEAELLARIVAAHLGQDAAQEAERLIEQFAERAAQSSRGLATDQLINAVFVSGGLTDQDTRDRVVELLLKELNSDLR